MLLLRKNRGISGFNDRRGRDANEIMDATGMDEEELAERYLENGYTIKEAAEETGADATTLIEEHGDDYEWD